MTVKELYSSFQKELSGTQFSQEADIITAMIFEYFAAVNRQSMISEPGRVLNESSIKKINESLAELKQHKPVQYIIGETWFYRMKLKVSPAVLIPRPETEELVDAAIKSLKNFTNPSVLDIGTGSGCIAIAIKKNIPASFVTAIDISKEALSIAEQNAVSQQVDIQFLQSDFLSAAASELPGNFDMIISNPPYIPENEMQEMDHNVKDHEPHLALFVSNNNPLIFYKAILDFANIHLNNSGMIFMETHEKLAAEVCKLFDGDVYKASIKKDMQGKERMVLVTRYL